MNLFKITDISKRQIFELFDLAQEIEKGKELFTEGIKITNLFFEPSTRTHYSFIMAEHNLNAKVINFNPEASSLKKGESLYDTIRTFEVIGTDLFIIRHPENSYFAQLEGINTPIINGGDGTGNHPTQSLLDLYTIKENFGKFEGLKVAIIGDIKHSRVAHTNIEIMKSLGMEVYISGPKEFNDNSAPFIEYEEALETMDVIMLLRVQFERHKDSSKLSNEEYFSKYGLTSERVNRMKDNSIIMHPAPFNVGIEIARDVVECSKSRIYKQMENGVYVRQALIYKMIKGWSNDT